MCQELQPKLVRQSMIESIDSASMGYHAMETLIIGLSFSVWNLNWRMKKFIACAHSDFD